MKRSFLTAAVALATLSALHIPSAAAQATLSPLTCQRVDREVHCGIRQTLSFQRDARVAYLRPWLGLLRGANIRQDGKGHKLAVSRNGSRDFAFVRQQGGDHVGTVRQDGNDNIAGLIQFGSGQTGAIAQSGDGRGDLVIQSGFRIR